MTATLSEKFKQAYLEAIRNAGSGSEFILPEDIALSRENHYRHMSNLQIEGKLVCAGPFADFSAALLVFDDLSEEEVQRIMEQDAHVKNSLITRWEVKEWHHRFWTNRLFRETHEPSSPNWVFSQERESGLIRRGTELF